MGRIQDGARGFDVNIEGGDDFSKVFLGRASSVFRAGGSSVA